MTYSPFENAFSDLSTDDLLTLKKVSEGWYVEYKSRPVAPRSLAKSLASFANHYGGWLFLGIDEDPSSLTARGFPGVPTADVPGALESLRNASKDLLNPHVFYEHVVLPGPAAQIGLKTGYSVVVIRIPPGPDSPYVHNDGRVYRRIADASDPKRETDRAVLDRLSERGLKARDQLKDRVTRTPLTSKGEKTQCYIHLNILSDPYEVKGDWYPGNFSEFSEAMRQPELPFDNVFPMSHGFIARQAASNDPYNRLFTWEFSRRCHSFVTLPLPVSSTPFDHSGFLTGYAHGQAFAQMVSHAGLDRARVLDLNMVFDGCIAIARRHRALAARGRVKGPFYFKVNIQTHISQISRVGAS